MSETQPPSSLTPDQTVADDWSVEQLECWLRAGIEAYTLQGKGPAAFPDIAHLIMNAGSLSATFRVLAGRLKGLPLVNLKRAVASVLSSLEPKERYVPVVEHLLAIAIAIKATPVLKVLGGKIGNGFFGEIANEEGDGLFTMTLYTVARLADPDQQDAKRCLNHLIGSANFKPAHAATALIALCQIDPEHLAEHLSRHALRERLAKQFERYDPDGRLRGHVAHQILSIIGLDNLAGALSKLNAFNPYRISDADDWLVNALIKAGYVSLKIAPTYEGSIFSSPFVTLMHGDPLRGGITIGPSAAGGSRPSQRPAPLKSHRWPHMDLADISPCDLATEGSTRLERLFASSVSSPLAEAA